MWEQGFSYICSASRWSWREFWSVPWRRQCGLMVGIKVTKSPCSWRCTQMDSGTRRCGAQDELCTSWAQGKCALGKRTFLHIFHCTNHRQFVFMQFCYCTVAGMGCVSLPLLSPPDTWGTWGSGAESSALAGEPGQELHMLRAPACSCWHPAFNLQTLEVFSPDLWLSPWGVCLALSLAAKGGTAALSHPSFPRRDGAALTSSTN